MASVKRAIENSLGAVENGNQAERLSEIREVSNPAKRAGLLAVHGVVNWFPGTVANHFGLSYQSEKLSRLDSGRQSDVFRLGSDTVLKVIREQDAAYNPLVLTPSERQNLASQLREQHEAMANYVGRPVLPHDIRVGRHPIERDRMAVIITQPYVKVDFLQLSDDEQDTAPLCHRLESAQRTYPRLIDELNEIVLDSRHLLEEQHLATDIVGRNVGVQHETGSVVIVDSQPVPPDRVSDQALVSRHFGRLESVLNVMSA